jgi:hypothetical protein
MNGAFKKGWSPFARVVAEHDGHAQYSTCFTFGQDYPVGLER